jgi:homocysteine S-methyltransferase
MKPFLEALDERVLISDGAMGTMLYAKGIFLNRCFDDLNLTQQDLVAEVHREYLRAGADILETNTFGANRIKLATFGLAGRLRAINRQGAQIARHVAREQAYVAGAIGPLGIRVEPWGKTGLDEAEAAFREQAEALAEGGVDLFAVETMMFPQEATAAIRACKAVAPGLPVMATMFFQYEEGHDRDRTMWGESPADVAKNLLAAGADVVGMNCGRGPDRAIVIIGEMRAATDAPLIAYPNAGLPITTGDTVTYELGPEPMAREYPALLDAGCNIVGACCGSNPEHIRLIADVVRRRRA